MTVQDLTPCKQGKVLATDSDLEQLPETVTKACRAVDLNPILLVSSTTSEKRTLLSSQIYTLSLRYPCSEQFSTTRPWNTTFWMPPVMPDSLRIREFLCAYKSINVCVRDFVTLRATL